MAIMRHSIVLRLTLIVAAIIAISVIALQWMVYRSTSQAFLKVESLGQPQVVEAPRVERIGASIQRAVARAGLDGAREIASDPFRAGLEADDAFLVVGPDLVVVASTEPVFLGVRARRDARSGALVVKVASDATYGKKSIDLTALAPRPLTLVDSASPGYLIVLPQPLDKKAGDQFAAGVWRSVALWLACVLALAMLATAWVMRRSLAPIDQLTAAARRLQKGDLPAPLGRQGSSEFSALFDAFDAATLAIARTETLRKRLISDIAHELRTPVTNLKGQLEALESGLITANSDFVATLQAETRLLERLVEDFQQLAITDAGSLRLNLQDLPLRDALESILGPLADAARATLELDVPPNIAVRADEQRLRQVLANLLDNAARHRTQGLRLSLSATAQPGRVELRFVDNGPGIDTQDRPHIFERFYRAEKSRNRATGGAGLGLAIARGIMQAMGGSIELIDDERSGACFLLCLPIATMSPPATSRGPHAHLGPS